LESVAGREPRHKPYLRKADIFGAVLKKANFGEANLSGAKLDLALLTPSDLNKANLVSSQ